MDDNGSLDALLVARSFVARAPIYMSLLSLEGRHLEVSPPFVESFLAPSGRSREDHIGHLAREASPENRAAIDELFARLAAGELVVHMEKEHQWSDGRTFTLRSQASYWRDETGRPVAVLFLHQDVTVEIEARVALAESESQLRAVVENMPAEVSLLDVDSGRILLMNSRAAAGLTSATRVETGGCVNDVLDPARLRRVQEIVANAEIAGGSYQFDWTAATGPFARRSYRMKHVVFHDPGGPRRLLWLAEDISELLRIQSEMEAAQEASLAKSQFLATMSHELRTPLNAVIGYAEMLEEELRDVGRDDCAGDAAHIRAAGRHLLALISEILDFSKVEAGRVELVVGRVDVGVILREAVLTVEPLAKKHGTAISLDIAPEAHSIGADALRLRQCVLNLLSNAAKFTENGRIDVNVAVETTSGARLLRIDVADTGCGISEEDAARLFQPFSQVDSSLTRRRDGAGLGLVITHRLSALMGGGVNFVSTPGQGSTFTLTVRDQFCTPAEETIEAADHQYQATRTSAA